MEKQTNMPAYLVGAGQVHESISNDWQPIKTAPRDGTVIETKCTYGVAPWYGLHKWDSYEWRTEKEWRSATDSRSSVTEGPYLYWRPFNGNPSEYVDPTNGVQEDMAYWRGALAAKYGLPPDTFEKSASRPLVVSRRIGIAARFKAWMSRMDFKTFEELRQIKKDAG